MLMPAAGAPIFMLALLLNGAGASFVDVAGAGRLRCRSRRARRLALRPTVRLARAAAASSAGGAPPSHRRFPHAILRNAANHSHPVNAAWTSYIMDAADPQYEAFLLENTRRVRTLTSSPFGP